MELKGKVALITGAAAGIGLAYSEELLKQGAKVSICDIDSDNGEQIADDLGAKYGRKNVLFCQCDVTDYPQYEEAFEMTLKVFKRLDIVINNAGVMNDRFWELEVDVNLDQYHVNLTGVRSMVLCPGLTDTGLVKEIRKQLMSSEYEAAWQRDNANSKMQTAEHVGRALIDILAKGPSGSVWIVENGQPPREWRG
ncbi:15-hydroxyprostaglandin dehydrogenase [NAD(+)]-like [Hyposmocoma kahamanoa]|uniref:15-hydroxyprostaglandin dehydrogenase [NAD(+)]-like n=1 Tax=Hyposmocoma kahamanoa TaxID=1477025 RepID=UPI000E6D80ED|nr:15-hydroxyprostaglandin dehydrogenase [NAD(+)]-like [Hyposmocoma kahamanoa]